MSVWPKLKTVLKQSRIEQVGVEVGECLNSISLCSLRATRLIKLSECEIKNHFYCCPIVDSRIRAEPKYDQNLLRRHSWDALGKHASVTCSLTEFNLI